MSTATHHHTTQSADQGYAAATPPAQHAAPVHQVNVLALIPGERRLSPLERQLYNALLKLAQQNGLDNERHTVTVKDLSAAMNGATLEPDALKRALKPLIDTVVEWQSPAHAPQANWEACGMLAGASLKQDSNGNITLEWRYAPALRHHVRRPEHLASLSLQVSGALRSHAALALYEICLPCSESSHLTVSQAWRWWRPVLTGNPGQHSAQYRYFKRDVLGPAMADINAKTDIEIRRLIESRASDNKTVTNIQFEVWPKGASKTAVPDEVPTTARIEASDADDADADTDTDIDTDEANQARGAGDKPATH